MPVPSRRLSTCWFTCLPLTLLTGPALAAIGHSYIGSDIFDDSLAIWNSSDIAGTEKLLVPLPGPFVLGIELDSFDSGWFVIPYNEGAGTAALPGLYRMISGVSIKVAPVPFKTPAFAGLERSTDGSFMYTILDRTWLGSGSTAELDRIDFDGTFTKLSGISIPGVAHPTIDGLTRNPATGELYFIENSSHFGELYKIDPTTFAITHIGSMGVVATGATNLAFSLDGSELVCLTNLYKLYSLNPLTGAPTLIGDADTPYSDFEAARIPAPATGMIAFAAAGLFAPRARRKRVLTA